MGFLLLVSAHLEGGPVEGGALHGRPDSLPILAGRWRDPRCRVHPEYGVGGQTFYRSKKRFTAMSISEFRQLRQLEHECRRLKRLVADLTFDKPMLQEVVSRKL